MDSTQQIIFITGACVAVALYLIYKIVQRRRQRKSSTLPPRMRAAAPRPDSSSRGSEFGPDRAAQGTRSATSSSSPRPASGSGTIFDEVQEEIPYAEPGDYVFGRLTPVLAAMLPTSENGRQAFSTALRNAGYYGYHAWHNFAAVRYLAIMLPILLCGTLLVIVPERFEAMLIIGLIVGPIFGWSVTGLYVRSKAADRLHEIENGMPDMLDLLNMCVSQGMTLSTALGRVSREIHPVYPALAKELTIVTDQSRIGTLSQALTNFSSRVDVPEVHSFTSLLIQTEQMGTSVSEALSEYSDNMRESQRQRADEKANAATFKLLFPTVLCLMPAVYLFLLGPAVIELNRFFYEGGNEILNTTMPQATQRPAD